MEPSRKSILFKALMAAVVVGVAGCGYVTTRGIALKPLGPPEAGYDSSVYKLAFSPRACFDPVTECDVDIELNVYAFGDTLPFAVPDSLNLRISSWDTVVVFDTAEAPSGRLWLWWKRTARENADGKKADAQYWLLAWDVARVREGDTLTVSFSGRAFREDGTSDTLRIRQAYVAQRFKKRSFVSI